MYTANYEPFARVHNEMMNEMMKPESIEVLILALEQIMLKHIPKEARILDLGCASAQLLQQLQIRGYQMTGIDASKQLLHYARINAPESEFILSDIRKFELPPTFDAVFSKDVLFYIINLEELTNVFQNVYAAIKENGLFVFNINLGDWLLPEDAPQSIEYMCVRDEYTWVQQTNYKLETRLWETQVTLFELLEEKKWQRSDTTWYWKCYFLKEIMSSLEKVGFTKIDYYNTKDLGDDSPVENDFFFVCRKPSLTR